MSCPVGPCSNPLGPEVCPVYRLYTTRSRSARTVAMWASWPTTRSIPTTRPSIRALSPTTWRSWLALYRPTGDGTWAQLPPVRGALQAGHSRIGRGPADLGAHPESESSPSPWPMLRFVASGGLSAATGHAGASNGINKAGSGDRPHGGVMAALDAGHPRTAERPVDAILSGETGRTKQTPRS